MSLENIQIREVLPKSVEDETIPTKIHEIDTHMNFLHDQMDRLKREIEENDVERVRLLNRARELYITTDNNYKIVEVPIYPQKHVDVEALKRLAPADYDKIVDALTKKTIEKMQEQMKQVQVKISQADVRARIASKALLAQIIPEPTVPSGWNTVIVKRE
jgi:predicted metal-dependent hydrolase